MSMRDELKELVERWERDNGGSIPAEKARHACARSVRAILSKPEEPRGDAIEKKNEK
jgi:hypothetical protein